MAEEKVISLNEFKVVMEEVKSQNKKTLEVIQHNHEQTSKRLDKLEGTVHSLKEEVAILHEDHTELREGQKEMRASLKELHEGHSELREGQKEMRVSLNELREGQKELRESQTEMRVGLAEVKGMLTQKVDRDEFTRLEKRVIKLERKIA